MLVLASSITGCTIHSGEVVGDSPLEQAASSIERILAGPSVLHSALATAGHQPIQEFTGEHYGFAGQNGVVYMHEGYSIGAARIWRGVGNSSDAAGKVQLRISSRQCRTARLLLGFTGIICVMFHVRQTLNRF